MAFFQKSIIADYISLAYKTNCQKFDLGSFKVIPTEKLSSNLKNPEIG